MGLLAACDQPSPLGSFNRDDVAKWSADCESPIIEEDPRDPRPGRPTLPHDGPAFGRANRRFRCPPPGWAIYTDDDNRIVGICVDDDTRLFKHQDEWISQVDRARTLITSHWGVKRSAELLKGVSDRCAAEGERIGGGMHRWDTWQLPYGETVYSQNMCCWELAN